MKILIGAYLFFVAFNAGADTMDHYMNISNQIPKMEIKADQQAQAWARSARTVLTIANESIAETIIQANEAAKAQGRALYCLPAGVVLNSNLLSSIIIKTFEGISSQQSDKNKMTVSQTAWLGVTQTYPCDKKPLPLANLPAAQKMQHVLGMN